MEKFVYKDGKRYKVVYTPYIVDKKTGKKRYPKTARVFRLLIEDTQDPPSSSAA